MKKLILSILFILCLSFQASALGPMMVLSGSGTGGITSCAGIKGSEDTTTTGTSSQMYATKYVHTDADCLIDTLELYVDDNLATAFRLGIYTHDAADDCPANRIDQTDPIAAPAGYAWLGDTITEMTLVNGTTYWFILQGDGSLGFKYTESGAAATDSNYENNTYSNGLPASWPGDNPAQRIIAFRASHS